MIKKILLATFIALPMLAAAQKFGTVSVESIFEVMPERTQIQKQLETASKTYQDEYKKLEDELNNKFAAFQELSQKADTPASIKERRQQELQELSNKAQQFMATAQQDLQRQQQQLMAPVEEKVMNAIKAVGQEGSFTFIYPEGVAVYAGTDVVDVTPMVKTKLGLK